MRRTWMRGGLAAALALMLAAGAALPVRAAQMEELSPAVSEGSSAPAQAEQPSGGPADPIEDVTEESNEGPDEELSDDPAGELDENSAGNSAGGSTEGPAGETAEGPAADPAEKAETLTVFSLLFGRGYAMLSLGA